MARDREFDALLSKYNILVTKSKDFRSRIDALDEEVKRLTEQKKHDEKLTRELCEKILANDKEEMRLGEEYSWGKESLESILGKTRKSYDKEKETNLRLSRELLKKAGDRKAQIDDLKWQLENMKKDEGTTQKSGTQEETKSEQETKKTETKETPKKSEITGVEIIDNDGLIGPEEDAFLKADIENQKASPTITSKGKTGKERKKAQKAIRKHASIMTNIDELMEKLDEEDKQIIIAEGQSGAMTVDSLWEQLGKTKFLNDTKFRYKITALAPYFNRQKSSNLNGNINVFELNDMGRMIYENLTGERAKSRLRILCAEHDNPEHGMCIMQLSGYFKQKKTEDKKPIYKKVSIFHKGNPVNTKFGDYVPDIVLEPKSGPILYVEFELNTHKTVDFDKKLDKLNAITNKVTIVVRNAQMIQGMTDKIQGCIKRRQNSLEGHQLVIRLGTANNVKNMENPTKNDNWPYCFFPGKYGTEVITSQSGNHKSND